MLIGAKVGFDFGLSQKSVALAAELNGYPGPLHAIELADQIGLSPDQVAKLRGLFDAMKADAIPLGEGLIQHTKHS